MLADFSQNPKSSKNLNHKKARNLAKSSHYFRVFCALLPCLRFLSLLVFDCVLCCLLLP
ncbi:hypothetical protein [Helicobacter sp. T3_23-1059]